jgi:hypothetical protein
VSAVQGLRGDEHHLVVAQGHAMQALDQIGTALDVLREVLLEHASALDFWRSR